MKPAAQSPYTKALTGVTLTCLVNAMLSVTANMDGRTHNNSLLPN